MTNQAGIIRCPCCTQIRARTWAGKKKSPRRFCNTCAQRKRRKREKK